MKMLSWLRGLVPEGVTPPAEEVDVKAIRGLHRTLYERIKLALLVESSLCDCSCRECRQRGKLIKMANGNGFVEGIDYVPV